MFLRTHLCIAATASLLLGLLACGDDDPTGTGGSAGSTTATTNAATGSGSAGSTTSGSTTSSVTTGTGGAGGAGGGLPAPWECVGNEVFPAPSGPSAMVGGDVANAVAGTGIAGVQVLACAAADIDCADPVASATSDAAGDVTLDLPTPQPFGFDGFFRTTGGGTVSSDHYYNPFASSSNALYMAVASPAEAQAAATLSGVTLDLSRGQALVAVSDCAGYRIGLPYGAITGGMTLEVNGGDANTKIVYVGDNNLPEPALTETGMKGAAVIFNIPVGPVSITATVVELGAEVSTFPLRSKAGEIAHLIMAPRP